MLKKEGENLDHFIVNGKYKDLLKYYNLDIREVLRRAALPEDILNHKTIHMQEDEYYRFMDAIASSSKDTYLAIKMATTAQIESFSPPIFASYCSKNGEECIRRLAKYKKLIGPMAFILTEAQDSLNIEIIPGNPTYKLPPFLVESEFAFLISIIRKATRESIVPVSIECMELPNESEFLEFAGVIPRIADRNSITSLQKDLELPFISYNEAMWDYFQPELTKRLVDLDTNESVSAGVRSALTELLPGGHFSVDDVAEMLGTSKRTLQRKLTKENTTFQKQLNNTRELLAIHYIKHTSMCTVDIAYLLGYSEVNSFLRAFTMWTGKKIRDYR